MRVLEFHQFAISNLFSYYAETEAVRFDVGGANPESGKNVVVIGGRNGYGKTSLLNSLRLLLYGPSKDMQETIRRRKTDDVSSLGERHFLYGVPGVWDGVFNSRARVRAAAHAFFVEATWLEPAGSVCLRRSWDLVGASPRETVRVEPAGGQAPLEGAQAQAFVNTRFPPQYSGFYLFDGEDLQRLAGSFSGVGEAFQSQVRELLGIQRVNELIEVLGEIGRSLPRRARVGAAEREITKLKGDEIVQSARAHELSEEERVLLRRSTQIERLVSEIAEELSRLRGGGLGGGNARELEQREAELMREVTEWPRRFATEFLPNAPLLSNPELVDAAHRHVMSALQHPTAVGERTIRQLSETLPRVFTEPPEATPPLTQGQRNFYLHRLRSKLAEYTSGIDEAAQGTFRQSGATRLAAMQQQLAPFLGARDLRREWARRLRRATAARAELTEVRERLRDASTTSETVRGRFESLVQQEAALEAERKVVADRLARLPADKKTAEQVLSQTRSALSKQLAELAVRQGLANTGHFATELGEGFFLEYLRLLEREMFKELGSTASRHWNDLMQSHQQIRRIDVDDQLHVRFRDEHGKQVGSGSISEGMKQIAATAILWALSDITNQRTPIIVDTPLGRIDLGHQRLMLEHYYPHAARQVIVLPTDSELDHEKYRLLSPHVYREYRLSNSDGRTTRAELGSLWGGP